MPSGPEPLLEIKFLIDARPDICFGLMRDPRIHEGGIEVIGSGIGQRVEFTTKLLGMAFGSSFVVTAYDPPGSFTDEMVEGPLSGLRHLHSFLAVGPAKTLLVDRFELDPRLLRLSPFRMVISRVLRRVVERRNDRLRELAEMENSPGR